MCIFSRTLLDTCLWLSAFSFIALSSHWFSCRSLFRRLEIQVILFVSLHEIWRSWSSFQVWWPIFLCIAGFLPHTMKRGAQIQATRLLNMEKHCRDVLRTCAITDDIVTSDSRNCSVDEFFLSPSCDNEENVMLCTLCVLPDYRWDEAVHCIVLCIEAFRHVTECPGRLGNSIWRKPIIAITLAVTTAPEIDPD